MIVPISSGYAQVSNAAPSETDFLMALADMHKSGHIPTENLSGPEAPRSHHAGKVLPMPSKNKGG